MTEHTCHDVPGKLLHTLIKTSMNVSCIYSSQAKIVHQVSRQKRRKSAKVSKCQCEEEIVLIKIRGSGIAVSYILKENCSKNHLLADFLPTTLWEYEAGRPTYPLGPVVTVLRVHHIRGLWKCLNLF